MRIDWVITCMIVRLKDIIKGLSAVLQGYVKEEHVIEEEAISQEWAKRGR